VLFTQQQTKLQEWFERQAASKHARFWLWLIAFSESSFFPIPADPFMAILLLKQREKWWQYALEVTIASVLGGLFGYLIGYALYEALGQPVVSLYNLESEFTYVTNLFEANVFWTVFTAAFTPIPYKIFTIAAGVAQVNIPLFVIASVIGRGLRFFIVGLVMRAFGKQLGNLFFKFFNAITTTIVVLIVLYTVIKFLF